MTVLSQTPLFKYAFHFIAKHRSELLTELCEGYDINEQDEKGQTLLMWATAKDNHAAVSTLIGLGANIDTQDQQGKKAIDYASFYSRISSKLRKPNSSFSPAAQSENFSGAKAESRVKKLLTNALIKHHLKKPLPHLGQFIALASKNKIDELRQLCQDYNIDADTTNPLTGQTLLEILCTDGYENAAKFLVEELGADINQAKKKAPNKLLNKIANEHKKSLKKLSSKPTIDDVAQLLIEKQVSKFISCLEKNPSLLNKKENWGDTLLIIAVKMQLSAAVAYLLNKGADIHITNGYGYTALDYAPEGSGINKLLSALHKMPAESALVSEIIDFHQLSGAEKIATSRMQDVSKGSLYKTHYGQAAFAAHKDESSDINATPAATVSKTTLYADIWQQIANAFQAKNAGLGLKLLEDHPFILNHQDRNGLTLLMHAAKNNLADVVATMLAWGADFGRIDNTGLKVYAYAAYGNQTYMTLLPTVAISNYCTSLLQVDADGNSPLMLAVRSKDVQATQLLLSLGADVNQQNDKGNTALLIAIENKHTELVDILLTSGARVNQRNHDQITPLMLACIKGSTKIGTKLLQADADVDAKDNLGLTALHYAAHYNRKGPVKLLLEQGAYVNAKSAKGKTALDLAHRHVDRSVFNLLNEAVVQGQGDNKTSLKTWANLFGQPYHPSMNKHYQEENIDRPYSLNGGL